MSNIRTIILKDQTWIKLNIDLSCEKWDLYSYSKRKNKQTHLFYEEMVALVKYFD